VAIVATGTFAGTGLAWTNAANNTSDGGVWVSLTTGAAWNTFTTSAASNVGTFSAKTAATPPSRGVWRTGASSPANAQVQAVLSATTDFQNGVLQLVLNKTASTVYSYYALGVKSVGVSGGGVVCGPRILRYEASAATTLLEPTVDSYEAGHLPGSTDKWVHQGRTTQIDGGASLLIQFRAWRGSNPATPPAACVWVSSGQYAGTDWVSCAVVDYTPLAAGRAGIVVLNTSASSSFTGTVEQFELRSLGSTTNATTSTATGSRRFGVLTTKLSTSTSLPSLTRKVGKTLTSISTGIADSTFGLALLRTYAATSTALGASSIGRATLRVFSTIATATSLSTRSRSISRTLSAVSNVSSSVTRSVSKVFTAVSSSSLTLARGLVKTFSTVSNVATLTALSRGVSRVFNTVSTGVAEISSSVAQIIILAAHTIRLVGSSTLRSVATVPVKAVRSASSTTLRSVNSARIRLSSSSRLRLPKD